MTANRLGLRALVWVTHRGLVLGAPSLSVTLWTESHFRANQSSDGLCCYCKKWMAGIWERVCVWGRGSQAPLQRGATFLVASLTNGSSFSRAVNCNRHQTPCTVNRGASSPSSIHCVTQSRLNSPVRSQMPHLCPCAYTMWDKLCQKQATAAQREAQRSTRWCHQSQEHITSWSSSDASLCLFDNERFIGLFDSHK